MARPTQAIVQWAVQDITLPGIGAANKKIPINDLQQKGYDLGQKPTADELNYLFNNWSAWIAYLDEKTGGSAPEDYAVDSTPNTTAKRDSNGISCFKKIRGELDSAASSVDFITTYEGKSSVTIYCGSSKVGQFVQSGLVSTGDAFVGLKANTAGTHYGPVSGNVTGNCTGNSGTTTKLATARRIYLTGAVTGDATFDGTSNVTIYTQNSSVPIVPFNNLLWTGLASNVSFSSAQIYDCSGYASDTGLIGNFKMNVYIRVGTIIKQLTFPLSIFAQFGSSFAMAYSGTDTGSVQVSFSAGAYSLSMNAPGAIVAVYLSM